MFDSVINYLPQALDPGQDTKNPLIYFTQTMSRPTQDQPPRKITIPPKEEAPSSLRCKTCDGKLTRKDKGVCRDCREKGQCLCIECNAVTKKPVNSKRWTGKCDRCFYGDKYKEHKKPKNKSGTRGEKKDKLIKKSNSNYQPKIDTFNSNVASGTAGNVTKDLSHDSEDDSENEPNPKRKSNKIGRPIIDFTFDDDSDSDSIEDDGFEDLEDFEYATMRSIFGYEFRVTKHGRLPRKLIAMIIPYTCTVNTMTFRQYELLLKSDPAISKYMVKYATTHGLVAHQYLLEEYRNYYFNYKQKQGEYMVDLNRANANVFEKQRRIYGLHQKEEAFNPRLKAAAKYLLYIVLAYMGYKFIRQRVTKFSGQLVVGLVSQLKKSQLFLLFNWFVPNTSRTNPPHTLFHTFPNFSRYLEEIIKSFPYGYKVVATLEFLKYGHWGTYKWHKDSSQWDILTRLERHKLRQEKPEIDNVNVVEYNNFINMGIPPNFEENICTMHTPHLNPFPLPVPKEKTGIKPYVQLSQTTADPFPPNMEGIFPMCMPLTTMGRPANTWNNKCATIYERVTQYPNSKFADNTNHRTELIKIARNMPLDHVDNPDWFENLRPEQKRNLEKVRNNINNGIHDKTITCQIKNDEVINAKDKRVARFVFNLSGEDFYRQGKITSEISHWLSDYWGYHANNGFTKTVGDKSYENKIYFTCGATSNLLDYFVNKIINDKVQGQLVMGDDTWMYKPEGYVIENDFSRYDRTHHRGLRNIFNIVLVNNGYSDLARDRQEMYEDRIYKMKHDVKKGEPKLPPVDKIHGTQEKVDQLLTGEPGTCLVNSFTNALTSTYILSEPITDPIAFKNEAVKTFEECGLICKDMIIHKEISDATFLKGAFLMGIDNKYHWIRLPSFLSKFGKVLKPHATISKIKEPSKRAASLLKAQWMGYGYMETNWFYKEINKHILRICGNVNFEKIELESWQIKQDPVYISDQEWNNFMARRYNITWIEMNEYLEQLSKISQELLPCVYYSSVIQTLLERDY